MDNKRFLRLKTIFIDDGGVINDNNLRILQWKSLVGQFFSPRFGGSLRAWASANEYALTQLMHRFEQSFKINPQLDYRDFYAKEQIIWLMNMFQMVNIDPPQYNQRLKIARSAIDWIIPRVRAAYPGVVETINLLKDKGYTLHSASGEVSWELRGYLTALGIVNCFNKLYGPDLINTAKASVLFYERIFSNSGVNPTEAMVIDDSTEKLLLAAELGATTIHVRNFKNCSMKQCQHHINQLNELPQLLIKF